MKPENTKDNTAAEIKDQQEKVAAGSVDPKVKLPEAIAKKYQVKPGSVRVFYSTSLSKTIDLNTISEADAEKLAKSGKLIKKSGAGGTGS